MSTDLKLMRQRRRLLRDRFKAAVTSLLKEIGFGVDGIPGHGPVPYTDDSTIRDIIGMATDKDGRDVLVKGDWSLVKISYAGTGYTRLDTMEHITWNAVSKLETFLPSHVMKKREEYERRRYLRNAE